MIYLPKSRLTLSAPKLRRQSRSNFLATPKLSHSAENFSPSKAKSKSIRSVGRHWLSKPAVIIRRDGKEICNPATVEGRAEYWFRTMLMWIRQDGWCCFREYDFCPGRLRLADCTFEHEQKRGAGKRDDRIALLDSEGGFIRHINGAAHGECNGIAGSRRLPIYHGGFSTIEVSTGKETPCPSPKS